MRHHAARYARGAVAVGAWRTKMKNFVPSLLLVFTAVIWGAAFLAQKSGSGHLGPFAFTGARSLLGAFSIAALVLALEKGSFGRLRERVLSRTSLVAGCASGAALFVATCFQQAGIQYTTPGVSGFLTSVYIVLVPVLGALAGRRPPLAVWPGVALAACGLWLICVQPGESVGLGRGEALTLVCAFCFALQILVVGRYAPKADALAMSCVQFLTGAALSLPFLALPEEAALLRPENFRAALSGILYCGVMSSGVAYTLQIYAQGKVAPSVAALLMSPESAFALLFGWLLRGDRQSPRQLLGCALVFAAVIVCQVVSSLPATSRRGRAFKASPL